MESTGSKRKVVVHPPVCDLPINYAADFLE